MIKRIMINILIVLLFVGTIPNSSNAAITEEQGKDVAAFARAFIEQGNERRDERGYPLLTYALSGNWNTCIEIRNKGYNEELYYIKRNGYHINKGKYVELGGKWCMDCGTFVAYNLKKTLGVVLYNGKEPWHVQDMYNDALRGAKSQYFEFVYKSVSVGKIDYSKLQPGDVIARITSNGNHGMLYVGDGEIAHANRDMITYRSPAVFGFQVSKLNKYYLPGTVVRVLRLKDGIVPEDLVVNSIITWPDNGETVDLLNKAEIIENQIELKEDFKSGEQLEIKEKVENDDKFEYKTESIQELSGEKLFEKTIAIQENRNNTRKIRPLMVHMHRNNGRLYMWRRTV